MSNNKERNIVGALRVLEIFKDVSINSLIEDRDMGVASTCSRTFGCETDTLKTFTLPLGFPDDILTADLHYAGPYRDGRWVVSSISELLLMVAVASMSDDDEAETTPKGLEWQPFDADHIPPEGKTVYMWIKSPVSEPVLSPVQMVWVDGPLGLRIPITLCHVTLRVGSEFETWAPGLGHPLKFNEPHSLNWQIGDKVLSPGDWCEIDWPG